MTVSSTTLIRAVASFPGGALTRDLAAKLDVSPKTIGARLSKLWMYGRIDRDVIPRASGGRIMVWRPHV
jgi:predicted ArsR family transcriptional regulator